MNLKLESILNTYQEDLWLDRKLDLNPLLLDLASIQDSNDDLARYAGGWIQFLHFLANECSGKNFSSDKQWNELLNLMEISRLVNYKTLKLKDLFKARQTIELKAESIRLFNEKARQIKSIESSLDELESIESTIQLDLVSKESSDRLVDESLTTLNYIHDRCIPLLELLELEVKNYASKSHKDPRLESWRLKLQEAHVVIHKLDSFSARFHQLQSQLSELQPLIDNSQCDRIVTPKDQSELIQSAVDDSLMDCKLKYARVNSFNSDLVEFLKSIASQYRRKSTSLILRRLLKPNKPDEFIDESRLDGQLDEMIHELKSCRIGLDDIVQRLRLEFGRFYFINDFDLLKVVTLDTDLVTADTSESRYLIEKIYNKAISSLILDMEDDNSLVGVRSPYGEEVRFIEESPIALRKRVNLYSLNVVRIFNEASRKLRRTLKRMLIISLSKSSDRPDRTLPVQLMNLAEQINFCRRVEELFHNEGPIDWSNLIHFYQVQLECLLEEISEEERSQSWLDKYKISASISLVVQFLSILNQLDATEESSFRHWIWQKQVRYNLIRENDEDQLEVDIIGIKFMYRFDFLPLQLQQNQADQHNVFKRLIATKMTDRCQMAAIHSLYRFRLGTNPYGPAGSGKTETIKALGNQIGCHVIVHNCDESNDAQSLTRLIWGLAYTGLWGCFDEFNRLSASVLSSVSSTLELIQSSLRKRLKTVQLSDGSLMALDSNSAFFITLNPSDNNRYRGRRRLPANLRFLFQPVAMLQVPIDAIVSESLMMYGGPSSRLGASACRKAGQKFQSFMSNVSRISLSNCEWDLRLVMATLHRFKLNQIASLREPIDDQIVSALRTEVECRLPNIQLQLFRKTLKDAFHLNELETVQISDGIRAQLLDCRPSSLSESDADRLIQYVNHLREQLDTRVGVMLLGPTGSGKSLSWRWLHQASKGRVQWFPINPRSLGRNLGSLLGCLDPSSGKWIDGLFSKMLRESIGILRSDRDVDQIWFIFDGPVDSDWVESLNSALDDNQVLTLSSGERLELSLTVDVKTRTSSLKSIKLILECDDISFSTPATISRLGLIQYNQKDTISSINTQVSIRDIMKTRLRELMLDQTKLLLLVGSDSRTLKESDFFVGCFEYICSRFSDADHLVDLISRVRSLGCKSLLLRDIHLLEPENPSNSRSFIELLRFILTYGGFYNQKNGWKFEKPQGKGLKLIAMVDSLESVEKRTLSIADVVSIDSDSLVDMKPDEIAVDELRSKMLNTEKRNILSIICQGSRTDRLLQLVADIECNSFENSRAVTQSLETLEGILSLRKSTGQGKTVFILTDAQLRLVDRERKSQLFHYLNCISMRPGIARFIYLMSNMNAEDCFWWKVGSIIRLNDDLDRDLSDDRLQCDLAQYEPLNITKREFSHLTQGVRNILSKVPRYEIMKNSFIQVLTRVLRSFQSQLSIQQQTLRNGLEKLNEFDLTIKMIKEKGQTRRDDLSKSHLEIQSLMQSIDVALRNAGSKRSRLEQLQVVQKAKAQELEKRQRQIKEEMSKVMPIVEASQQDIKNHLKPEALREVRTLRAPPKAIKDIMDALFMILGIEDSSWNSMKSFLAKTTLREELTSYDFDSNHGFLDRVELLMSDPSKSESFDMEKARRASQAIVPILRWIKAALEYGKVSSRLAPLREGMNRIRSEQEKLKLEITANELELNQISQRVKEDTQKLEKLKVESKEAEDKTAETDRQIDRASRGLKNSRGQIGRWQNKLKMITLNLEQGTWLKYGLLAAAIVMLPDDSIETSTKILSPDCSETKAVEDLANLVLDMDESEVRLESGDLDKVKNLLALRIMLDQADLCPIPFVDVPHSISPTQLRDSMYKDFSFRHLIDKDKSSIEIIRCDEYLDWMTRLNIAARVDKIIVLHLVGKSEVLDLDILDYLIQVKRRGGDVPKVIIAGPASKHQIAQDSTCYPIKRVELTSIKVASSCTDPDTSEFIMERMIDKLDPQLSQSRIRLELQSRDQKMALSQLEGRLIQKLASSLMCRSSEDQLDDELISILDELHEKSHNLEKDLRELGEKLNDVRTRRQKYRQDSDEATKFYVDMIEPLGKIWSFYSMDLSRYSGLLLDDIGDKSKLNYFKVCHHALSALKPEHRAGFLQKLAQNKIAGITAPTLHLTDAIADLVNEEGPCLMIALHEPTKPSPQMEVDDIFKKMSDKFEYSKVYATSDSDNVLEEALRNVMNGDEKAQGADLGICLCVANAHLASSWINSRLIGLVDQLPKKTRGGKVLVILIGESTAEDTEFDSNLLNFARLRYWHDELGLTFGERFKLFENSYNIDRLTDWELISLSKQLILLHVVCQEIGKAGEGVEPKWIGNYPFDHNQLNQAMETLHQLYKERNSVSIGLGCNQEGAEFIELFRSMVCNYFESIVYGSIMETEEDELRLSKLIHRFLGSDESKRKHELALVEKLIKLEQNQSARGEYGSLLRRLLT